MIPPGVDIYFAVEPIDLRWGFDRLCGIVTERVGRRPRSGSVFAFFGRRRTAMKLLYFDGTGLCLLYKRLDAGTFKIPISWDGQSPTVVLNDRELHDLVSGLDLVRSTRH
jgi:transposase